MQSSYESRRAEAAKIERQLSTGTDRIVRPRPIRAVCKAIWPDEKLDAFVAGICDCSPRTAERYLSDEIDAPAVLFATMWMALTRKR